MNPIAEARRRIVRADGAAVDVPDGAALRALAGLLRTGMPVRAALVEWPDEIATSGAAPFRTMSRRARLGGDLAWCVSACGGGAARALSVLIVTHARSGGNLAAAIEEVATAVDERDSAAGFARAQASGARASARLIAWLPLASPILVPGGFPTDPAGVAVTAAGAGLCAAGFAWMKRLLPVPQRTVDPAELVGLVCAAAARAGADHRVALEVLASTPGVDPELERIGRLIRLGQPWGRALGASSVEGYRALGRLIRTSERLGAPLADDLEGFVLRGRVARRLERESASRRAAVKMAIPLTVCILPAFLILALGPHLSGLAR